MYSTDYSLANNCLVDDAFLDATNAPPPKFDA